MVRNLAPGGWIELQDFNTLAYSEDGSAQDDNKVVEFCRVFNAACDKIGRHGSPGQYLKEWTEEAGFVNVHHDIRKVPVGPWARDKKLVNIVAIRSENTADGILETNRRYLPGKSGGAPGGRAPRFAGSSRELEA